ncbi:MAG: glycine oxidase ThiO [Aquificae bacterium]|nr:glycine oxidase ThiO [Aquificota bacterium]
MRIVVVGGGIIGLSISREFHKLGYEVVVVDKGEIGKGASWVAGGMLAPQSEGLEPGIFLDFCLESRDMYQAFTKEIFVDTGLDVGYWKSGIFCPAFSLEEKVQLLQKLTMYKNLGLSGEWIDREDLEKRFSSLGEDIVGGVFYPEDAQVDNRLLMEALTLYCREYNIMAYEHSKVEKIITSNGKFEAVRTDKNYIDGDVCILAAGAWSGEIADIPVFPIKGEMSAVDIKKGELDMVFFSSKAYLIPRKDYSRLVIGATEEKVGFKDGNTVKGVLKLLNGLIQTFPHMRDRNIQEMWYGYRPATPDLEPILGESDIEGLFYATGHHRNGILLAPITVKVITDLIHKREKSEYLESFSYKRFLK